MDYSEAARLSALSRQKMKATIDSYAEQFQPKIMHQYKENGHLVTVFQPAYADGYGGKQYIKSTARNGYYEGI